MASGHDANMLWPGGIGESSATHVADPSNIACLSSLSEILCVRHTMSKRSMYAKQDEQEESSSGAAEYSERNH
jgi:hypothetical protein